MSGFFLSPIVVYLAKWVFNFGALADFLEHLCLRLFLDGLAYLVALFKKKKCFFKEE